MGLFHNIAYRDFLTSRPAPTSIFTNLEGTFLPSLKWVLIESFHLHSKTKVLTRQN